MNTVFGFGFLARWYLQILQDHYLNGGKAFAKLLKRRIIVEQFDRHERFPDRSEDTQRSNPERIHRIGQHVGVGVKCEEEKEKELGRIT